ncbi:MAG TPA: zinc ribbon domain-containing protein [Candidatus Limnocylindrales bacterium]|nr:zinc ribbon domain-containing protein [Candidatus Limnocylindrales bacterium]
MPIYEFACTDCQHRFDVFGGYDSREATQVCPSCEGTRTRALFSTVAVTGSASEGEAPAVSGGGGCGGCGGGCACSN